ncbi:MAG TPA: Type 1 glutamine amidotransferase-like domain-containing protein [Actinomycetota bacterium]|nr:Type 1 glutamine amidotransferase-like domain-containing protein [Actinomycetota bacterium]
MSTFAFLGAGEFEGWHADVDRRMLAGRDGRVLVFATASAPEGDEVYGGWVTKGLQHYIGMGADVEAPPLRSAADAHDPDVVGTLEDAALVFFSGGNPAYLASVLAGSPFWQLLVERVRDGRTAYAGCSAGVACLCDPTFDTNTEDFEQVWAPGLGYVPGVLFAPHWDMVDQWIPGARAFITASAPAGGSLVALDERTAMVGDGSTWDVHGEGGIYVYRDGDWVGEHTAGATFTLSLHGEPGAQGR